MLYRHCVAFYALGTNHVAAKTPGPSNWSPRKPSTCRLRHVHGYNVYTGSAMPAGARSEFGAVLACLLGPLLAGSASDASPGGNACALAQCICFAPPPVRAAATPQLPVLQAGRCGLLLTGGFCAKTCGFCQCPAVESSPAAAPGPSKLTCCSLQCPGLHAQPRELLPLATDTADKHVTRTGCKCDDIPPTQEFGLPANYTCQQVSPATAPRSRQLFCLAGCLPPLRRPKGLSEVGQHTDSPTQQAGPLASGWPGQWMSFSVMPQG